MLVNARIRDWVPVVYTLSEAEAYIYWGTLQSVNIPCVVCHNSLFTAWWGYNSFDEYSVLTSRRLYETARVVLGCPRVVTYDRKQMLGRKHDVWVILTLGMLGFVPIILMPLILKMIRYKSKDNRPSSVRKLPMN